MLRSLGERIRARAHVLALAAIVPATWGPANQPPAAPTIREPAVDGLTLNPSDVHMETAPFSDPDAGDEHRCTDWEIWTVAPSERVWSATCITGVERVHAHLGDGVFAGSHAGRADLVPLTDFLLRVRHSDDSGDPSTEWSPWSQRTFRTGSASQVFPLELEDVVPGPAPRWVVASDGSDVILPVQTRPPHLVLESGTGEILLAVRPRDGASNALRNPAPLPEHAAVRVRIEGGTLPFTLPPTDVEVVDEHCATHRILLPSITFSPLSTQVFWVGSAGTTYAGDESQTAPDFSVLARGLPLPWSVRPGFRVETFAAGLQLPVNIAFVPSAGANGDDPFLYVTELYGKIRVVARDGSVGTFASGLLNFSPTGAFPGSGEQGVAGIAVDPASGDVFATMLYASAGTPSVHYPKIVRFTSQDGGRTAATQTTILDMTGESQGQSHQISNLTIAPDGKLLCHVGDGFDASTAQNLDSFRGKILRLNLDGSAPSDNPFYSAGDGISARDYVYAYGVRNPFGGDWRAADASQYVVENGPSVDRFAKIVRARNYLWDGSDASMANFAIYNWNPAHGPVNLVFVQPETFGGSGFPASVLGHAFVSESGPTYATGPQAQGKRITEWILDGSGHLVAGPIPFLEYAGNRKATACGLEAGPDGLYMTELYYDQGSNATQPGARILRIRFDGSEDCNQNGVADACDVGGGTSADVNGNAIPDECESGAQATCFGDGSGAACPCGNAGLPGRGCDNSLPGTGGALLTASGGAFVSADTLVLTASGEIPTAWSLFWQAGAESAPTPYGDGLECLAGPKKRLYFRRAEGGTVAAPHGADPSITTRSAALGDPIAPGTQRVYQVLYRDASASFCAAPAGATFNTTNASRVLWGP